MIEFFSFYLFLLRNIGNFASDSEIFDFVYIVLFNCLVFQRLLYNMHGKIIVLLFVHVLGIITYGWFVRNPFIVTRHHRIVATLWAEDQQSEVPGTNIFYDDKISVFFIWAFVLFQSIENGILNCEL